MNLTCCSCGSSLPLEDFGKVPIGSGRGRRSTFGRSYRCKFCISEAVKRSLRYKTQLPRFAADIEQWRDEQLDSELVWLNAKTAVVRDEMRFRQSQKAKKRLKAPKP